MPSAMPVGWLRDDQRRAVARDALEPVGLDVAREERRHRRHDLAGRAVLKALAQRHRPPVAEEPRQQAPRRGAVEVVGEEPGGPFGDQRVKSSLACGVTPRSLHRCRDNAPNSAQGANARPSRSARKTPARRRERRARSAGSRCRSAATMPIWARGSLAMRAVATADRRRSSPPHHVPSLDVRSAHRRPRRLPRNERGRSYSLAKADLCSHGRTCAVAYAGRGGGAGGPLASQLPRMRVTIS